jgi:hypothetical protein
MLSAVWMFFGIMVALTAVPVALTIGDVLKCRKDNKVVAGNGQRTTHSSLGPGPQDKAKGINIVRSLGDHHKAWALSAPALRTVSGADGRTHYVFGLPPVL